MLFKNNNQKIDRFLQLSVIIITYIMIVLRVLMNEKGRVNPDSLRYMRQAYLLPTIDNTTAPLGYPFSIKLLTYIGLDEFWSSKVIALLTYTFMLIFAYRKQFYFREVVMTSALFSFVSIFSFTMSEPLILPFVFFFMYCSKQVIDEKYSALKSIFLLSLSFILLYNIRYSSLFIMAAAGWFGLLKIKSGYGKYFMFSSGIGVLFMVFYKFLFIDYFNETYVHDFLNIGLKPTSQLLVELYQGLTTSFNPFIHISDPNGGIVNFGIYGIGLLNIFIIVFLFWKNKMSNFQQLLLWIGVIGIVCSYFVQYFYSVNPIDYRLIAPFTLAIWLVYFQLLYEKFGNWTYAIAGLSLLTGFGFTWLSKGNYLENREEISNFLDQEQLKKGEIKFYLTDEGDLANIRTAELISTVYPNIRLIFTPKDTLKAKVLTPYKVDSKIKLKRNEFQKFNKK